MSLSFVKKGFTLVELMLAVVLSAMIFLPVATMMVAAFREPAVQNTMLFREAGADMALQLLRNRIRSTRYNDISFGSGIIQFSTTNGVSRISKIDNSLVYIRNGLSTPLIDDGVEDFSVFQTTNAMMQCSLSVIPFPNGRPVVYALECGFRN